MQMIDGEQYLGVEEAVALLGVKKATLYAYVSRGLLTSFRQGVGRQRLYRRSDIEGLLALRSDLPPAGERPASLPITPVLEDDRTLRDVDLPPTESWAGDH
jgi:excisionase family DNA binding protein